MHYIETIVVTLPVTELIYIDGRLQMLDVSHAEWILIIDGWKKIVVLFPPKMSPGSSITSQLQKRKKTSFRIWELLTRHCVKKCCHDW
ncbi:hypothetical protein TNIN_276821 [Trichonephila inaurata madagascariensis]|uniref:Uncharacterized protein n=1 Tax=Trichonephila inaurata madagascariensis TaxID=2747483 RepID=A0A8X6XT36_9ARAC|nr:hypothetical protein TNIN_276821 [Trichonephila inaurata madagascariensis]